MKSFGALCLSLILVISISAQPEKAISNKDTYNWMFGASWILTDDDGESFNPFLVENLHGHLFPTQLIIDKYIYNGWSAECALTYSKYNPEKITNSKFNKKIEPIFQILKQSCQNRDIQFKLKQYKHIITL